MPRIYSYLPDTLQFNGRTYKQHIAASALIEPKDFKKEKEQLKKQNYLVRTIQVLSRNLRGKTDLHHKPYKPTQWLFIHQKNK